MKYRPITCQYEALGETGKDLVGSPHESPDSTRRQAAHSAPKIGQIMTVRGKQCQIVHIHPFGTVDVCNLISGKAYRVTGLPFISENDK